MPLAGYSPATDSATADTPRGGGAATAGGGNGWAVARPTRDQQTVESIFDIFKDQLDDIFKDQLDDIFKDQLDLETSAVTPSPVSPSASTNDSELPQAFRRVGLL
jgi:hypothetical protein